MLLSQKKTILWIFFAFFKARLNFEHFGKKDNPHSLCIGGIRETLKDVVRQMSRKSRFRRPLDKRNGKRSETLLKYARQQLCQIYCSLWKQLRWKKSVLGIWRILGLFVNTLTAKDKYFLLNRDNFNAINSDAII